MIAWRNSGSGVYGVWWHQYCAIQVTNQIQAGFRRLLYAILLEDGRVEGNVKYNDGKLTNNGGFNIRNGEMIHI